MKSVTFEDTDKIVDRTMVPASTTFNLITWLFIVHKEAKGFLVWCLGHPFVCGRCTSFQHTKLHEVINKTFIGELKG